MDEELQTVNEWKKNLFTSVEINQTSPGGPESHHAKKTGGPPEALPRRAGLTFNQFDCVFY